MYGVAEVAFAKQFRAKAVVYFSKKAVQSLDDAAHAHGFVVQHVVLSPGRLGLPLMGVVTVTILRDDAGFADLVPALVSARSSRCVSPASLLQRIDVGMESGWVSRTPPLEICDDAFDVMMVKNTAPVSYEMQDFTGDSKTVSARKSIAASWAGNEHLSDAIVDVSTFKKPIYLGGIVPPMYKTAALFWFCNDRWTRLLPIHKMALLGCDPKSENLSVMTLAKADSVVSSAVPTVVVFTVACALAAVAR